MSPAEATPCEVERTSLALESGVTSAVQLKLSGDRADRMRHVPGEPHRLCFALSLRRGPELVDYLPPTRHLAHEDGIGPALDFSRVSSSTAVPSSSAS